ncbi:MAG: hypothetical protein AB1757_13435 [Acidobacteriota bacterium]
MTPEKFAEIVEIICKRYRLYTRYGTLAEVVAFLDGAGNALNVGGHLPFTNFLRFLAKKLNQPRSYTLWEFLLNIYGNEEKVLEELPKLYRKHIPEWVNSN